MHRRRRVEQAADGSGRRLRLRRLSVAAPLTLVLAVLGGCVADSPPLIGVATAGNGQATVSWQPPLAVPAPIVAYVVTPWIGQVRQTPIRFNSTATTQAVTGLSNGATYTFTVVAINALGNDSASSSASNPVTLRAATTVAAGQNFTCAIVSGGAVKCWGANNVGQLGNATTSTSPVLSPGFVTGLSGATSITAGDDYTCVIVANGAVDCWGANFDGRLGHGGPFGPTTTPVAVTGLTGVTSISARFRHTCAVVAGGAVECWGQNDSGDLGNGTFAPNPTPMPVVNLSGATSVTAGETHTCAIVGDGAVNCWGDNQFGQFGNGTNTGPATTPVTTGLSGATSITAGQRHTCAIMVDGAVKCWGGDQFGQLGNGTVSDHSLMPVTTGLTSATSITAGQNFTCAMVAGGAVYCWGRGTEGQLGDGNFATATPTPVAVMNLTDATSIGSGVRHECAAEGSGSISCWGLNGSGQLGDQTTTNSSEPVAVDGL